MVASVAAKVLKGLVKSGRKSKRGRKSNKEKLEKAITKKKNPKGSAVFPQPKDKTIKRTKKEKREILSIAKEQKADRLSEVGKSTAGGNRDSLGRLKSSQLPPKRKDLSAAQVRRLVKQGSIKINNKGEVVNTGEYGRGGKISAQELAEVKQLMGKKYGGTIKKKEGGTMKDLSGDGKITQKDILIGRGVIKRKHGGAIGVGKALRGYGKGYK
jgi:hypothetical protein